MNREYPEQRNPAAANIDPPHETLFTRMLDTAMQKVAEQVAGDSDLPPFMYFELDEATSELRDVRLSFITINGVTAWPKEWRAMDPKRGFQAYQFTETKLSVATGEEELIIGCVRGRSEEHAKERAKEAYQLPTATPEALLRNFLGAAGSIEELDAVLDTVCSDTFLTAADQDRKGTSTDPAEPLTIDPNFGAPLAEQAVYHPKLMPQIQNTLLQRMAEKDNFNFYPLIRRMDLDIAGILIAQLDARIKTANDPIFQQVADFLAPFEALDMLAINDKRYEGILGYIDLATLAPFSELLLRNLARRRPAEHQRQITQNAFFAKMFLQKKLERFSRDWQRHPTNVNIIRQQLFPDEVRIGSLSRMNLIELSNVITASRNKGLPESEQPPPINVRQPGATAEAVYTVLSITTANYANEAVAQAQPVEDGMTADIIAMLLEANAVPRYSSERANVSVAGIATLRARQRHPGREIKGQAVKRPGYGKLS